MFVSSRKSVFQRVGAGSELIQNDTQGSRERSDLLDKDPADLDAVSADGAPMRLLPSGPSSARRFEECGFG